MMIMKKIFNALFVIIAAMVAFAGCQKEENNAPETPETKTVQFFANSIETKTHFGDKTADNKYPTLWDAGDKVKVLMNLENVTGVSKLEATSLAMETTDIFNDGASARFKVELNSEYQTTAYTYFAVAPSTAYNAKSADDGRLTVIIPSNQTPTANGLDKAAQIVYAVSETYPSIQDAITLNFKHFTAYGKFSLTNLTDQIGAIASVSLEFEDVNVAGKWNYYPATDTKGEHDGSNKISLTTSSATDLWFACAPIDVSGKTMKVTVTDVNGKQLVKEITMPADRVFESGKISSFTINMNGILPPVQETTKYYKKVTESQSDWTGTYLIVYEDGAKAYVFNATDAANGYLSATISDGTIASTSETDAVQVTIESMTNGYSIKTSKGYVYGNSSKNQLNFNSSTKQANTISYSNNSIAITSGRVLQFNSASDQMRFRYYSSGTQKPVQLYKLVDGESGGETPEPEQPETPEVVTLKSIAVSGQKTAYNVGDAFVKPTVTATYSDESTKTVTDAAVFNGYDLSAAGTQTVTVQYTEEGVTVNTTYSITVTGATATKSWKLVTDASTLKSGDKLAIVSTSKGKIASATISSSIMGELSVTITNNSFATLPSGAAELTLGGSSGAWTLTNASGKKLGATAVKKVAWGSGTTTWAITIASNGDATIQSTTSSYGRFLHNVNSPRFTTYTSAANASMLLPQLYRYE